MSPKSWIDEIERRNGLVGLDTVLQRLLAKSPLAVWLGGSLVRACFRASSDIDCCAIWKTGDATIVELPSEVCGHDFNLICYDESHFLDALHRGSEFAVWQITYGLFLGPSRDWQHQTLSSVKIGDATSVIQKKLEQLRWRIRLIEEFHRADDRDGVVDELHSAAQQILRMAIIASGFVPGCRAELVSQARSLGSQGNEIWTPFLRIGKRTSETEICDSIEQLKTYWVEREDVTRSAN